MSRAEHEAYCLLGLFDVNMPLFYGEGGRKAFRRLQQATYEMDADCSLFLFKWGRYTEVEPLLAETTEQFYQDTDRMTCLFRLSPFPEEMSYSKLIPIPRNTSENDHFLQLVRSGVMVKLPTIGYNKVQYSTLLITGAPDIPNPLIVILPLSHKGYEARVFGTVV
jgi:hypothetical protein